MTKPPGAGIFGVGVEAGREQRALHVAAGVAQQLAAQADRRGQQQDLPAGWGARGARGRAALPPENGAGHRSAAASAGAISSSRRASSATNTASNGAFFSWPIGPVKALAPAA